MPLGRGRSNGDRTGTRWYGMPDTGAQGMAGTEGQGHACDRDTAESDVAKHFGHPPSVSSPELLILRLKPNSRIAQPIFYLRFWRDLYDFWRPFTSATTSAPYCSSLRAPIPGIATSAASSVGRDSAMAISVLSVNT